ncbi:Cysteine proteinase B [Diplonema papillatum]|nr:Cysteine proteinase B [Diplonema papillatum]
MKTTAFRAPMALLLLLLCSPCALGVTTVREENAKRAQELEAGHPGAQFRCTKYANMTEAAFLRRRPTPARPAAGARLQPAVKAVVDWRTVGAVTSVKDEGDCPASWAYSVTGNVEGAWFLAGNALRELSTQELIDCVAKNRGCQVNGTQEAAFQWVMDDRYGVMNSLENYPTNSTGPGQCKFEQQAGAVISRFEAFSSDENEMLQWVMHNGPLATSMDPSGWQLYSEGVFPYCRSGATSQAVLLVGFDTTAADPYWIVKNSWGKDWGVDGYISIPFGTNACSVTSNPISGFASFGSRRTP